MFPQALLFVYSPEKKKIFRMGNKSKVLPWGGN
jgi:hypothetical protein